MTNSRDFIHRHLDFLFRHFAEPEIFSSKANPVFIEFITVISRIILFLELKEIF